MKKPLHKKHSPWFEIFLVCSIITLGSIIFYFTRIDNNLTVQETSASPIEETLQLETIQHSSSLKDVSIMTVTATHPVYPFEISYPKTTHSEINDDIYTYITAMKEAYINSASIAHNVGEIEHGTLNMTTKVYSYLDRYYSFVLTTTEQLTSGDAKTTVETFFLDNQIGKLLTIANLFNDDEKSLQTFAKHIQSQLLAAQKESAASIEQNFAADWQNFQQFALYDDKLALYLANEKLEHASHTPMFVTLSSLNPLLHESFQTEKVNVIKPINNQIDSNEKRIALTFDDGPHPVVTPQILAILEKYNAKATFYMLGTRVEHTPDIVKQAFEAGHEIGNHTWSHPKLPKLSAEQILSEFQTTEDVIRNVVGEPTATFRPPYGMTSDFVNSVLPAHMVYWTIDTEDWRHRDPQLLLPSVKDHLHNNAIVLMHDIHQSTADGLESLLAYLQAEGYTFMTVSDILPYRNAN